MRNPKTPGALATSGGAGWFETLELGCYIFDREASVLIPSMGERFGLTFAPLESRTSAVQLIACCAVVPRCRRSAVPAAVQPCGRGTSRGCVGGRRLS